MDLSSIACAIGVTNATVGSYRKKPEYKKARGILVGYISRQGIQFRLDCQRKILAPVYAELIIRMNNRQYVEGLGQRELLDTIKVISSETRFDGVISDNSKLDNEVNELEQLQEIQSNSFSQAEQFVEMEKMKQDSNVINYPKNIQV